MTHNAFNCDLFDCSERASRHEGLVFRIGVAVHFSAEDVILKYIINDNDRKDETEDGQQRDLGCRGGNEQREGRKGRDESGIRAQQGQKQGDKAGNRKKEKGFFLSLDQAAEQDEGQDQGCDESGVQDDRMLRLGNAEADDDANGGNDEKDGDFAGNDVEKGLVVSRSFADQVCGAEKGIGEDQGRRQAEGEDVGRQGRCGWPGKGGKINDLQG